MKKLLTLITFVLLAFVLLVGCKNEEKKSLLDWCIEEVEANFDEPISILMAKEINLDFEDEDDYSEKCFYVSVCTNNGIKHDYSVLIEYASNDQIVSIDCNEFLSEAEK